METPTPPAAFERYHARMRRVFEHVDVHLGDHVLDLEALAAVAAFSKFHFQRQFAALFGLGVHRYVQLLRLNRAAWRLALRPDATLLEIALDAGYESQEGFARAFRQRSGQSPGAFRAAPDWAAWGESFEPAARVRRTFVPTGFNDEDVQVVDVPRTAIAVMPHRGDPALVPETLRRFIAWRRRAGLSPARSQTFNLLHEDPETCPPEAYRIDLCAGADEVALNGEGVVAGEIPAGRCARLRVVGAGETLRPAVAFLYADWLPRSGEELRDFPVYVQRVRFFPDVPAQEAVTDVFLPLRAKG